MLYGTNRSYYNYCCRLKACHTALDIQELLSTQVSTEACFRNYIIS